MEAIIPTNHQGAARALKAFFESAPLLHPTEFSLTEPVEYLWALAPSILQLPCSDEECRDLESTTWNALVDEPETLTTFQCAHCKRGTVRFWVVLEEVSGQDKRTGGTLSNAGITSRVTRVIHSFKATKVGQWPQYAPKLSRKLIKSLGDRAIYYKRGVMCLSEGFGVGACAYFRRVVEEETVDILKLIKRAADAEGSAEAVASVEEAMSSGKPASERLKLAARKLPTQLRPGGANPLAVLYGAFSEGVHELSESDAVEQGKALLAAFEFLFERVRERLDTDDDYARTISKGRP